MRGDTVEDDALRRQLDDLAADVAGWLDGGDPAAAWAVTRALEAAAQPVPQARAPQEEAVPPLPVIGRRFARAHRRLLAGEHAAIPAAAVSVAVADRVGGGRRHGGVVVAVPSRLDSRMEKRSGSRQPAG